MRLKHKLRQQLPGKHNLQVLPCSPANAVYSISPLLPTEHGHLLSTVCGKTRHWKNQRKGKDAESKPNPSTSCVVHEVIPVSSSWSSLSNRQLLLAVQHQSLLFSFKVLQTCTLLFQSYTWTSLDATEWQLLWCLFLPQCSVLPYLTQRTRRHSWFYCLFYHLLRIDVLAYVLLHNCIRIASAC